MSDRDRDDQEVRGLRARVRTLEDDLLALRVALLRTVTVGVVGLLLAGLWLPVYREGDVDGGIETARTATTWYAALVDPGAEGDGFATALGIGFAGLLLVELVVLWVLLHEVIGAAGSRRRGWLRGWAVGLAVVGSLVPALFSLVAAGSESSEGGWGGPLLLVGSIAAAVLVTRERSQELWLSGPS